ncbi:restriction endonuclease subunit S [Helicobacter pylori]|nr:restriction endonuclease subunit S [Helicobacter pylori]
MHKIEQLLQTLAPKGVGFRKLGEVCEIIRGKRVTKKEILDKGKYPVVSGGIGFMGYLNEYNREENTITIAQYGTAGFVNWQNQKFWANDVCFSVIPKETLINRYLYYVLTNMQNYLYSISNRSAIPYSISSNNIMQITIPIPPLEIQQEIVKILDAFTELNTELKARKKQYQYYQNMLLDFNDINQNHQDAKERLAQKTYPKRLKTLLQTLAPKGVESRKLGEVCEILDNRRIPIAKNKRNPGIYPYYGANGIQDYIDSYIFDGDFVLVGEDGSVINKDNTPVVNWASGKIWVNNHAHVLQTKNELKLKFLYFYLQTIDVSYCVAGTPPKINQENLKKITIPIPPLEIQQEIVKILDQFSLLTTDLLAGIPAEIKARKKQYEYYREKLLTFKPLTPLNNKELAVASGIL